MTAAAQSCPEDRRPSNLKLMKTVFLNHRARNPLSECMRTDYLKSTPNLRSILQRKRQQGRLIIVSTFLNEIFQSKIPNKA